MPTCSTTAAHITLFKTISDMLTEYPFAHVLRWTKHLILCGTQPC
jgi:hypothetical protein